MRHRPTNTRKSSARSRGADSASPVNSDKIHYEPPHEFPSFTKSTFWRTYAVIFVAIGLLVFVREATTRSHIVELVGNLVGARAAAPQLRTNVTPPSERPPSEKSN